MKTRLKELRHSETGEGLISALYTMMLLTIIFFIGIDIAGYTATAWKLRNACSETLTLMKIENGYDSSIEKTFLKYVAVQGLDTSKIRVSGTPKLVQRGDMVIIRATVPYTLRSLRPFNHELQFTVNVEMSGLAQEFFKENR